MITPPQTLPSMQQGDQATEDRGPRTPPPQYEEGQFEDVSEESPRKRAKEPPGQDEDVSEESPKKRAKEPPGQDEDVSEESTRKRAKEPPGQDEDVSEESPNKRAKEQPGESEDGQFEDVSEESPRQRRSKIAAYPFTREQDLHLAQWLIGADWLWNWPKMGVSIVFRILFICIYM